MQKAGSDPGLFVFVGTIRSVRGAVDPASHPALTDSDLLGDGSCLTTAIGTDAGDLRVVSHDILRLTLAGSISGSAALGTDHRGHEDAAAELLDVVGV
jgi:hypothetical protein